MLLQALRVEIEMKNLNIQVTFLMQKGVGTRSHPTTPLVVAYCSFAHLEGRGQNLWILETIVDLPFRIMTCRFLLAIVSRTWNH